ncbi:MAG: hypothetical protein IJ537_06115 [Bacteroidaceae bacterium]|nr:hypothetical protein [Bacteroidaceae bacterium]
MNNLIVNVWPVWGMVIAITTVVYLLWPSRLMKKSEYATFFLCSFSIFWLLMLAAHIYMGGFHHATPLTGTMFLAALIPWMTVAHLFWPFKETKRNPQLTFFSVAFTGISLLILVVAWILVLFSDM